MHSFIYNIHTNCLVNTRVPERGKGIPCFYVKVPMEDLGNNRRPSPCMSYKATKWGLEAGQLLMILCLFGIKGGIASPWTGISIQPTVLWQVGVPGHGFHILAVMEWQPSPFPSLVPNNGIKLGIEPIILGLPYDVSGWCLLAFFSSQPHHHQ